MNTVINKLAKLGWTGDDERQTRADASRLNVWGSAVCWSNYAADSDCGNAIIGLWVNLQPFLFAADPTVRPKAVRLFVEAADVVAFG